MTSAPIDPIQSALLGAVLPHVAFDGWSDAAFAAAAADAGIEQEAARRACPRGGVDLAALYHRMGDAAMLDALAAADLSQMRIREKITHAISLRLTVISDKEAVRRGTALFALPLHAPEGAKLIWGTADAMWRGIGDGSDDVNWYTKRLTLSAVWSSVVLYWLGDTSEGHAATHAFIDRRIEDVMKFEKTKAQIGGGPLGRLVGGLFAGVRAPRAAPPPDMPGHWTPEGGSQ